MALLKQQHVSQPALGQVIGDTRADDTTADDDRSRPAGQWRPRPLPDLHYPARHSAPRSEVCHPSVIPLYLVEQPVEIRPAESSYRPVETLQCPRPEIEVDRA